MDITKFLWGRLGGIAPKTFWPPARSAPWIWRLCLTIQTIFILVSCLCFREPNEEAARLVREMKLENSRTVPMKRMYRNGQPQSVSRRVFAITSAEICGFWRICSYFFMWTPNNGYTAVIVVTLLLSITCHTHRVSSKANQGVDPVKKSGSPVAPPKRRVRRLHYNANPIYFNTCFFL